VAGIIWIMGSAAVVYLLSGRDGGFPIIEIARGCAFVVVSAVLIYVMLRRALGAVEQNAAALEEQRQLLRTVVDGEEPRLVRLDLVGKDGAPRHIEPAITPLHDSEHGARVLTEYRDVTQEAAIERQLAESEQRLRLVIENSQNGIVLLNASGQAVLFNSTICRLLGYTRDELPTMRFGQFLPEPERTEQVRGLHSWMAGGAMPADWNSIRLLRSDGTIIEAELAITTFTEEQGERRLLAEVRDVTAQRMFERRLEESERRFRTMVENAQNGLILLNAQGNAVGSNRALERMLGYTAAELTNLRLDLLADPADRRRIAAAIPSRARDEPGAPITTPVRLRRKDHSGLDVQLTYTMFWEHGEVRGSLLELRDVTREQALQRQLSERVAELTSIFEAAPLAIADHR